MSLPRRDGLRSDAFRRTLHRSLTTTKDTVKRKRRTKVPVSCSLNRLRRGRRNEERFANNRIMSSQQSPTSADMEGLRWKRLVVLFYCALMIVVPIRADESDKIEDSFLGEWKQTQRVKLQIAHAFQRDSHGQVRNGRNNSRNIHRYA